jgi:GT2 family glycosyltransferase
MTTEPSVAIIVLNYNNYEDTAECIESLREVAYDNYETIVVDNASSDDSFQRLQAEFEEATFLETEENRGYAAGNNYGIECSLSNGFEYVFVLNNDTIVHEESIAKLIDPMEENDNIGIVGPMLYYYDTNKIQSFGAKLTIGKARPDPVGHREIDTGQFHSQRRVEHINGAAMMVRSELFNKIGSFDESFGFYTEDLDLCLRARKASYEILVTPDAKVWHKVGSTMNTNSGWSTYYRIRSKFIFNRKHGDSFDKLFFYPYILFHILHTYIVGHVISQRNIPKIRYISLGILHGIRGVTGLHSFD